jgi:hypothetical protein
MISEIELNQIRPQRVCLTRLKPKRRFKFEEVKTEELPAEPTPLELCPVPVEPVRVEFGRHHRARIRRSGRVHTQWRRVTPPSELSETMAKRSHSELLARVMDKVKRARPTTAHRQSIWAMLRQFALALR